MEANLTNLDWQQATCYLNGEWTALANARISVLDRGFVFGDGVYEVIPVDTIDGVRAPFRARQHFERLQRSLDAIRIPNPFMIDDWLDLAAEIVERHPWPRQIVYVQITRGVAKREHQFPTGVAPTVWMTTSPWPEIAREQIDNGIAVVSHADERWLHCDIKSTSLLGSVLMKQYAIDNGAAETLLLRNGFLTEGSSTNLMIVADGVLIAPHPSTQILGGITVDAVTDIARAHAMPVELRPIAEVEVRKAAEIWLSSSGREVMAVVSLDGAAIGNGRPGPAYRQMQAWFQQAKLDDARAWAARLRTRLAA